MIHDVLLSCIDLGSNTLPIQDLVETDGVFMFLHPSEKKILSQILNITNILREIRKFTKSYNDVLREGSYLNAFTSGLDNMLQDYIAEMASLELEYMQNSRQSLLIIYEKLRCYEPLAHFFLKLIHSFTLQELHGCIILQFIHQYFHHGDRLIHNALKNIHLKVNLVFLKQLSNWVLYARTVDKFDEFFIQNTKSRDMLDENDKESTNFSSGSCSRADQDELEDINIWDYEICAKLIPKCFSICWAEKVLFIGQTVLLFEVQTKKNKFAENCSLWNREEYIFLKKIQNLQGKTETNIADYEKTIDDAKAFVTKRLSTIAINQANLIMQLKILKEYYLLTRGELFLEFIRKMSTASFNGNYECIMRDLLKTFECAANSVGALGLDRISIGIPKFNEEFDNTRDFDYINEIELNYRINWPLQILFSPKVIARYNLVFRFLLRVKKIQYQLHLLWSSRIQAAKKKKFHCFKIVDVHNQLMFFIDNLQYYIQVDVLESQFSLLLNSIINETDFERIEKAHIVFQANILSLCFLLTTEEATNISVLQCTMAMCNNDMFKIFQDLFNLSEEFCSVINSAYTDEETYKNISDISTRLRLSLDKLVKFFTEVNATRNATPLAQFLLRLDFNHWFSSRKYCENRRSDF